MSNFSNVRGDRVYHPDKLVELDAATARSNRWGTAVVLSFAGGFVVGVLGLAWFALVGDNLAPRGDLAAVFLFLPIIMGTLGAAAFGALESKTVRYVNENSRPLGPLRRTVDMDLTSVPNERVWEVAAVAQEREDTVMRAARLRALVIRSDEQAAELEQFDEQAAAKARQVADILGVTAA